MTILKCDGILTVGDPHLSEKKPARRLDHDYLSTLLYKLQQAADIANENNAQMIICGDLFDDGIESGNRMMSGLFSILRSLKHKPICLAGNHDLVETKLTEGTTLKMVETTGLLDVVKTSGCVKVLDIGGQIVGIGATPYGFQIPEDVTDMWPTDIDKAMWITHKDIAFPGAYPGAIEFFEIKGVDIVVNGHMHLTQEPHQEGSTLWTNPGNIIRQSVDTLDHIPKVALYTPQDGQTFINLHYIRDTFNLEGYQVNEADKKVVMKDIIDRSSCFAAMISDEVNDRQASDDGGFLKEDIASIKESLELSKESELMVDDVYEQSIGFQPR